MPVADVTSMAVIETFGQPTVLLLSIETSAMFDKTFATTLERIGAKASIHRIMTVNHFMRYMEIMRPSVIILTDVALCNPEYIMVLDRVIEYAKSGGTVVAMGNFPSLIDPEGWRYFFRRLDLDWTIGYHARDRTPRTAHAPVNVTSYVQEAVFARVKDESQMWYCHPKEKNQAASAMARLGEGRFGYVGDLEEGNGTSSVVLAMCGLAEWVK